MNTVKVKLKGTPAYISLECWRFCILGNERKKPAEEKNRRRNVEALGKEFQFQTVPWMRRQKKIICIIQPNGREVGPHPVCVF